MQQLTAERKLPWDWHDGVVPTNVELEEGSHLDTSYSLALYRSREPIGLRIAQGTAVYTGSMFDLGPRARVTIGRCSMINCAWIVSDHHVEIGDYALISWNAVIMDTYRTPTDPAQRRVHLERFWSHRDEYNAPVEPQAVVIRDNVWIGFDAVILPGVTIGSGSIVGARSVVNQNVPPYTIVAGNPARVIRHLKNGETNHGQ
jgi:acetyltransferase-like isoleucine patch superfamily enzyme